MDDKLDLLLNLAADATVGVDVDGQIIFTNGQANRLSGYSDDDLLGKPIEILLPDIFSSSELGRRSLFLADPETQGIDETPDSRLRMKNGSDIPVAIGVSRFAHEKIVAIFFVRDVTDLLQAQQSLLESREEFRTVIEHAPNPMLIVDESGSIQLVNTQTEKLLGYMRDELLGHPVELLVPDSLRIGHAENRAEYYSDPKLRNMGRGETPLFARHKNGNEIPVEITVSPLKTEDGLMVVTNVHDLSTQYARQQELKTAFAEIDLLKSQLEEENVQLKEEAAIAQRFEHIVGESLAMRTCLNSVGVVAETDANVLILGETGTGKELIARAIHELSPRKKRRMVVVNCAALPQQLIESELFGHEKGAFTGAISQRKGRFEMADGGTLFLDEIAELPVTQQTKLLRILQDGDFERVGGTKTLHTDVRLIAATNQGLKDMVDQGDFRADLYYRINTFPIVAPPLRERKEDIPLLAEHFVRKHAEKLRKSVESISTRLLSHLNERTWPGNIRELEGFIVRCLISTKGSVLTLVDEDEPKSGVLLGEASARSIDVAVQDFERDYIRAVLDKLDWKVEGEHGAASSLGVPASTLRSKITRLGIKRAI